jgi:hypothetical protein
MAIPAFNASGVLPPHMGNPTHGVSPYVVTASELVGRFATTRERIDVLTGLLTYRSELAAAGILDGFQWLDGSFAEDIETLEGRPPADIDVVTFARRPTPVADLTDWTTFFVANKHLFDPNALKARLKCDAYYVDLDQAPNLVVTTTAYWCGLFSHRRAGLWKGMPFLPLMSDDTIAGDQLKRATPP